MGSVVGSILGTAGGAGGTGFSTPQQANIHTPVTDKQATDSYNANQEALKQQQSFLQALQGQNGIQNQSNVYNQLQGIAAGTGPNPAQAMLNQATGANVANQAALMAGQRGSSANVGLMARQAAQQGAATQQQAAGQAATQQAQQSLGAIGQAGNLASAQVANQQAATNSLTQAQQNEQKTLLDSIAGVNNANVSMQSNINQANAGLANTAMQGQQAMLGSLGNAAGAGLQMAFKAAPVAAAEGGVIRRHYAEGTPNGVIPGSGQYMPVTGPDVFNQPPGVVPQVLQANTVPVAPSSAPPQPKSGFAKFIQGAVNGQPSPDANGPSKNPDFGNKGANALYQGMSGLTKMFQGSQGRPVPENAYKQYEGSGFTADQMSQERSRQDAAQYGGLPSPNSAEGQLAYNPGKTEMMPASNDSDSTMVMARGGKVPAMVSPGEVYLPPHKVKEVVKEGKDPIQEGKKVPGKPKVGGDVNSYANDTVPATLEEGGIVLPRSVTQSKNPHWAAHKFVLEVMKKKGKK